MVNCDEGVNYHKVLQSFALAECRPIFFFLRNVKQFCAQCIIGGSVALEVCGMPCMVHE